MNIDVKLELITRWERAGYLSRTAANQLRADVFHVDPNGEFIKRGWPDDSAQKAEKQARGLLRRWLRVVRGAR